MDMLNHKQVYLKSLEEGMKGVAYSTLPPTTTSSSPYFVDLNNAYNIGQFAYDIGKSISANCGGTGGSGGGTGGTVPPHDHDNLYAPKIHDHNDLYYTKSEEDAWRDRLLNGDLLYNKINANHIQAGSITAGSTIIANGAIGSAQISSLSVDKLEAGIIDTSKFTVQGTNGHLKIINNKLQIIERNGVNQFERVALGDIVGDGSIYGLVVRGKDGQTVLYDENGVYNAGITNGAITDEKVGDNANIHGTKLNISSVIEGINGDNTTTINGLKVDINGESINTVINQITMKQDEHTESINRQQSEINQNKNEIALKVSNQKYTEDMTNMTSRLDRAESDITILNEGIKLTATKTEVQNQIVEVKDFVSNEINDITIGGANYLYNSFPRKAKADTTLLWDKSLNGTHQLTHWQDYNANVQNPQVGYHPHIDLTTFNFPCIALINKNNTFNMPNRELALKQELLDAIEFIVPDEEYTISFDAYSDVGLFSFTGGLYHNVAESPTYDYHSGRMDVVVQGADINTWKRYYYTFRTHKGVNVNNPVYFVINGHNNPEGSSYVKNIKLERGNKPSHWTPSEFDTVDSSNDVLDEMKDYVDTSIRTLDSSIDIKLDSITTKVESVEVDFNNKVNNIKVGARNLQRNTEFKTDFSHWNKGLRWSGDSSTRFEGVISAKYTLTGTTASAVDYLYSGTNRIECTVGEEYTASAYFMTNNFSAIDGEVIYGIWFYNETGGVLTHFRNTVTFTENNKWFRLSTKATAPVNAKYVAIVFGGYKNGTFWMAKPMLEKGNIVSDWSPHPDDYESVVDGKINVAKSEIKQTTDSITLRVQSTEGSVNDLNTKYTEIKQTVDGIDLTGVVRFHDLATQGATIINGSNITTGTISGNLIKGGIISASEEINFVGGARIFGNTGAYGAGLTISAQSYSFNSGNSRFEGDATFEKSITATGNIKGGSLTGGQLTINGNASISSTTTNQLEVYGATRCNGTFYASGEGTFANTLNVKNAPIYGMNNIALARGIVYIAQDNLGAITTDHFRIGDMVLSSTDNTRFYFTSLSGGVEPTVYFANKIALGRGTVYLPAGGGNHVTDYLRIGGGIMSGVDSGNFHFLTLQGVRSAIYCGTVNSTYSLNPTAVIDDTSVFDEISSINVINSDEGYKAVNLSRDISKSSKIITTSYNEQTDENEISMDVTSSISMLIKAVQELKQENEELKLMIKEGK